MVAIVLVGIDLAKNVFALHGVDVAGKACLVRPAVRRDQLLEMVAKLAPCTIGMEACSGAHHWARQFMAFGHTVRLMAPKFVVPYRMSGKRGKNDAADAAAICEAVGRPTMRFVPVKGAEQQGTLVLHRSRELLIRQRTMLINALRAHLAEFGVIMCQGRVGVSALIAFIEGDKADLVPEIARVALLGLIAQLRHAQTMVNEFEGRILEVTPVKWPIGYVSLSVN